MIETDAIRDRIEASEDIDYPSTHTAGEARDQLDALLDTIKLLEMQVELDRKEAQADIDRLTPQWLPAGKLPEAAGWWLWWDYESGDYEPVRFYFKNGDLHREYRGTLINQTLFGCGLRDRFAPMPRWDAPK